MPPQENHSPLPTDPMSPIVPQMPPAKGNKNLAVLTAVIVVIIVLLAGIWHFMRPTTPTAQVNQQVSTGSASSTPGSLAGTLAPSASNSSLTTYTGTGDTFFSFAYPTSFKLNQFPSGVSLIASANDPLTAGLTADDNHEFDIYIGGDTEKQVRASVILATTTKVMDAPTEGYTTYDLVLPHVVYHVIELYIDQGHDLDLVTLGSYDTASSSPATWMSTYKAIVASVSIDKNKLAQFIADAKARGAAQAATSAKATSSAGIQVK